MTVTQSPQEITRLLGDWSSGDRSALDKLIPLVHAELRRVARRQMSRERADHTLQPTALVNEAYLKLAGDSGFQWQNRAHFFAVCAQVMRHILVDHARTRSREKRGGTAVHVSLTEGNAIVESRELDLVALDDALTQLAQLDSKLSQVVELRYFGGMTIEETAEVLAISHTTARRRWDTARAWLRTRL